MSDPYLTRLDQHFTPAHNLNAFAYTNALLNALPVINSPILHFWTLEETLILGMKDQRLPHLSDALAMLQAQGIHYFVRNSGGLAVVSDDGVLNSSFFLSSTDPIPGVDAAYQLMTDLVTATFPQLPITAQEVPHSYCPGKFDLAVNGVKIGGMSQRRNPHGIVVMLYLSVTGDQTNRASLVADFYRRGLADTSNQWHFPDVWPSSMTTLEQLIGRPLSVSIVADMMTRTMTQQTHQTVKQLNPTHHQFLLNQVNQELANMQRRQAKLPSPKEAH